uniref:protein disulfide-isomerase n=1 Tax=Strigamia maritima TaxID=126957 RepID=T1ITB5_STRMM
MIMLLFASHSILFTVIISVMSSDVQEYSDDDFSARIRQSGTALVEFYAPWCGHCKQLEPEYEKAATFLKNTDPPITLVKNVSSRLICCYVTEARFPSLCNKLSKFQVDCIDSGKDTCRRYGVSGYPMLKVFRNGEFYKDYFGPREAKKIVTFMLFQIGPSSMELTSVVDIKLFLSKQEVGVIGFFEDIDRKFKKTFDKVAEKLHESTRFAHTSSADIIKKYKYKNDIVLFRPSQMKNKFEDSEIPYKGDKNDKNQLERFIKENYHGLVGHRTAENIDTFTTPLIVAYYKVDYVKNAKDTNYWRNSILKVAKAYSDQQITFAISNREEFTHEMTEFGIKYSNSNVPVVAARNAKFEKFVMGDEFTPNNFIKFINDFLTGKLTTYMKSEPLPKENNGPVKVVVARNFDKMVLHNDKDVIIEFYAPWCGHCKKLLPVYDQLGREMLDEDVEILKMDATANDVPVSFAVSGFPTLFWVSARGKKRPMLYNEGRELDDFIRFIAKHAMKELKRFDRQGNKKSEKVEL